MSAKKTSMRCRIVELEAEVSRLRAEKDAIAAGVEQMRMLYDAIITAIVRECGRETENGAKFVAVPKVDVAETVGRYDISTLVREDGMRVIAVIERERDDA